MANNAMHKMVNPSNNKMRNILQILTLYQGYIANITKRGFKNTSESTLVKLQSLVEIEHQWVD